MYVVLQGRDESHPEVQENQEALNEWTEKLQKCEERFEAMLANPPVRLHCVVISISV